MDKSIDAKPTSLFNMNSNSHNNNSSHHKWTFLSKVSQEKAKDILEKLSASNEIIGEHIDTILSIIFSGETGVVNLSDIDLTEAQLSILSKGLTFCPTPGELEMSELRQDLDKFHLRLKHHVYFNRDPVVPDNNAKVELSQSFCNVSQSQDSTLGPKASESLTQMS